VDDSVDRVEVVAGMLVRDGHVLLCHRSADRTWYPDVWDFPGGHVEAGEGYTSALVRELREELGIAIAEPSMPEIARLVSDEFDMRIWVVTEWTGVPVNASPDEHDHVAWKTPDAIAGLSLADDSYPSLIAQVL
jgi:8-oxo-dGTP diphosphatase